MPKIRYLDNSQKLQRIVVELNPKLKINLGVFYPDYDYDCKLTKQKCKDMIWIPKLNDKI